MRKHKIGGRETYFRKDRNGDRYEPTDGLERILIYGVRTWIQKAKGKNLYTGWVQMNNGRVLSTETKSNVTLIKYRTMHLLHHCGALVDPESVEAG